MDKVYYLETSWGQRKIVAENLLNKFSQVKKTLHKQHNLTKKNHFSLD